MWSVFAIPMEYNEFNEYNTWAEKSRDFSIGGATRKWTWFILRDSFVTSIYIYIYEVSWWHFVHSFTSYSHLSGATFAFVKKWKSRNIASWSNIFWWEKLLNNHWNDCRNVIPHLLLRKQQFIDGLVNLKWVVQAPKTHLALEGQKRLRMRES